MELVVLISAYREGPLVAGAIESALRATPHVCVFEGPAGAPLEADVPATDYTPWLDKHADTRTLDRLVGDRLRTGRISLVRGEWKTDAKKRTAMIEWTRRFRPEPTWALWLDGDELLVNPERLREWTQLFTWRDEVERMHDPEAVPTMGWPIRLVELDGSVALCRGKVIRADLVDSYSVSSSVFKTVLGFTHGEGNVPERLSENDGAPGFGRALEVAVSLDRMVVPSWFFAEPFLIHRSLMRHPLRQGLRLHEQEAVELEKAKLTMQDVAP